MSEFGGRMKSRSLFPANLRKLDAPTKAIRTLLQENRITSFSLSWKIREVSRGLRSQRFVGTRTSITLGISSRLPVNPVGGRVLVLLSFIWLLGAPPRIDAQPVSAGQAPTNILILEIEGSVEINRSGASVWDPAQTNL